MNKPLLTICCISYNHLNFIEDALKGFLSQKTNFEYDIIINDDASNDGTTEILKKYKNLYADKIKLIIQDKNQYSQGVRGIAAKFTFPHARGKYIAICEGDDYWTDPLKLQKQVDFLEANPDYGICFHNVAQLNMFSSEKDSIIPDVKENTVYTLEDYILSNRTATCSLVFKRELLGEIPSWFYKVPFGDLALILLVMYNSNKKGMVLRDTMGVYRIHENGIHGSFHKNNKSLIKAYKQHLQFNKIIASQFLKEQEFKKVLFRKMKNTHKILANLYATQNDKIGWFKSSLAIKYYGLLMKLN